MRFDRTSDITKHITRTKALLKGFEEAKEHLSSNQTCILSDIQTRISRLMDLLDKLCKLDSSLHRTITPPITPSRRKKTLKVHKLALIKIQHLTTAQNRDNDNASSLEELKSEIEAIITQTDRSIFAGNNTLKELIEELKKKREKTVNFHDKIKEGGILLRFDFPRMISLLKSEVIIIQKNIESNTAELEVHQKERIKRTAALRELISIIQVTIETIDQSAFAEDTELNQLKYELIELRKIIDTDITHINQANRPNYCDPYGTEKLRLRITNKAKNVRERITLLETTGELDNQSRRDSLSPKCLPHMFYVRPRSSSLGVLIPITPTETYQDTIIANTV